MGLSPDSLCDEICRPTPRQRRDGTPARSKEALEVLTRCLRSDDDRVAMMAAQAILDRGYGRPVQSIDANISEDRVRYYAEVPVKDESTEEWLKGNPVVAQRNP